jgi:two-component system chemotaxis response regulator CheB
MSSIRVLVIEDSLTIRKRLVEVLGAAPGLEVVGEAADGQRGVDMCRALRPDVVTLDMMMPVMSGVAATEHIMAFCPTPIVIVSSSTNRGELFRTYDALAAGAVDVLDKPNGSEPDDAWERRLIATVKLVSRIKVITHVRARLGRSQALPSATGATGAPLAIPSRAPAALRSAPGTSAARSPRLVAIGASTGGPAAIVEILRGLEPGFPLPILLVIHIGESFGAALAEWLDGQTSLAVSHARDGDPLPEVGAGAVIMAPPGRHLELRGGVLRVTAGPERHSCRPSVDVLFESIARERGGETVACLLTGMGRDGAEGLLAIRRAGGITVAQDAATSVVYGMPREAAVLGAAERILPLGEIAPTLRALAGRALDGRGAP